MDVSKRYVWLWGLLAALFFLPFLGRVHLFDWDEINFAECAREMLLTGNYLQPQIDFQAFYEKPPLFFWLQSLSMKIWGVGEYGARFPNAICGMITLVLLFRLGERHFSTRFGMLWAGAYFGSLLPHLYFKSGIIDPSFNLLIFLSLYHFIRFYWEKEKGHPPAARIGTWGRLGLSAFFMGLAILAKGPAAFLIMGLVLGTYWIGLKGKFYVRPVAILTFGILSLLVCGLWFGLESAVHGPAFLKEFVIYQYRLFSTPDAGHGGFPGFHLVVLLVGCFPASVFAVRAFFLRSDGSFFQKDLKKWMQILFWVVLILFSIVQSKIIHYSSLCYFPLTFLAAYTLDQLWEKRIRWGIWLKSSLLTLGLLIASAVMLVPFLGKNAEQLKPWIQDPSGRASLEAEVYWSGWEGLVGLLFLLAVGAAFYFFQKGRPKEACISLFGGGAVFVWLLLAVYINKIEGYSQAAPLAFFESLEGKDVFVQPMHYKTYAHLFYTKKPPPGEAVPSIGQLIYEEVDKDVYISTKIHKAPLLRKIEGVEELQAKNGFVFFRRTNKK